MAKNFQAQVAAFVLKSDARLTAVVRESTKRLVDEAQTPVGKGGKMRVDTGFLRASGQMSLTGLPTGPVRGENKAPNSYTTSDATIITSLAGFKLGNSIYFGWTANYAKYREAYDGFLSSAVANWQQIVDRVCADLKSRIG